MKKWVVLLLTSLLLSEPAWAACFGFSEQEMPEVVADYICQYPGVQARLIAVMENRDGSSVYYVELRGPDGAAVARVMHELDSNGALGNILYFQLPDGTVLLDRRPAVEEKGQPG